MLIGYLLFIAIFAADALVQQLSFRNAQVQSAKADIIMIIFLGGSL